MLQIHRVYIITFWFLFQLFIEINCQISPHVLKERRGHTATLFDKKLYILGGFPLEEIGNEFFYIDFSVSFNTQNLKVNDLSNINTLSPHYNSGSAIGGANNNTLFILVGISNAKYPKMESINTFNPRNTINLVWKKASPIGTQNMGLEITSILLPDNKIIYLDSTGSLAEVYIYDTVNNNWSTKTTTGTIPPKKDGGSAVLGLDGKRVITFGGFLTASPDQLHELNLINFEWRILKSSGSIPESRRYHKANVIGNYMVLSFGLDYKKNNENDILLLDISNINEYIWTNEFKSLSSGEVVAITSAVPSGAAKTSPIPLPTSPSSSPSVYSGYYSKDSNNISSKIGVIVVFLVSGVVLLIVGAYLFRRCRNRIVNESNYNQYEAENYSYYPVQDTVQLPVPASLINNDIDRNRNESNYYPGQEIVQPPAPATIINTSYNHGRESVPIFNDEIQILKREIQDLKQIILQNNKQSFSSTSNN
ncbi:hypothetical protein RhiirC2_717880 [Rhizophagus irregularis]|uniref:Galactose oxidase n=1 Tax=Rhizophagus irregularis TaxID=588596 RepID=A0A2N1MKP9_9GLOM|nr:hypothetical protein RhiirC2_717880 [Rhizophagus irregularis]